MDPRKASTESAFGNSARDGFSYQKLTYGYCTSVSLLRAPRVVGVPEANGQQPPSRRCLRIIPGRGTEADDKGRHANSTLKPVRRRGDVTNVVCKWPNC